MLLVSSESPAPAAGLPGYHALAIQLRLRSHLVLEALALMEVKSNIIKKEGEALQQGERILEKQNVTIRMDVFSCSICSKPLGTPIFQCSKGNSICSTCCEQLPESERAVAQRCYIMERVVNNMFVPCKH